MNLSFKIRQLRYAKGWGPDDLAARASISRTALYQIESGRTELPRAATLRRIARALGVTPENLMGEDGPRDAAAATQEVPRHDVHTGESAPQPAALAPAVMSPPSLDLMQEIEVERKFRILLHSPLRDALVKIVEQSYRLLPPNSQDMAV